MTEVEAPLALQLARQQRVRRIHQRSQLLRLPTRRGGVPARRTRWFLSLLEGIASPDELQSWPILEPRQSARLPMVHRSSRHQSTRHRHDQSRKHRERTAVMKSLHSSSPFCRPRPAFHDRWGKPQLPKRTRRDSRTEDELPLETGQTGNNIFCGEKNLRGIHLWAGSTAT